MTDKIMSQENNPLHGITLEKLLTQVVEFYGWRELSKIIEIRCFFNEPSIKSSLKFLRHTPWAREKLEKLYLNLRWHVEHNGTADEKRRLGI